MRPLNKSTKSDLACKFQGTKLPFHNLLTGIQNSNRSTSFQIPPVGSLTVTSEVSLWVFMRRPSSLVKLLSRVQNPRAGFPNRWCAQSKMAQSSTNPGFQTQRNAPVTITRITATPSCVHIPFTVLFLEASFEKIRITCAQSYNHIYLHIPSGNLT